MGPKSQKTTPSRWHTSLFEATLRWSQYQIPINPNVASMKYPDGAIDPRHLQAAANQLNLVEQTPPTSIAETIPAPRASFMPDAYQAGGVEDSANSTTDESEENPNQHRPTVESSTAALTFYDLESLHNIFTVVLLTLEPVNDLAWLDVYHLIDDDDLHGQITTDNGHQRLVNSVLNNNPALTDINLGDRITVHDLRTEAANYELAERLAISDSTAIHTASHHNLPISEPICDTHPSYDPTSRHHAICAGYNSANYDTTMLAIYFSQYFATDLSQAAAMRRSQSQGETYRSANTHQRVTAAKMREHNDKLFTEQFVERMTNYVYDFNASRWLGTHPINTKSTLAGVMRTNMLRSGRHIDVSRFNEVQRMMSLERQLGQLGHQMLGFDNLSGDNARVNTLDEVVELLTYNVSDVVGLKLLFDHPIYSGSFDQRAKLIETYPECVYTHTGDKKTVDIRPEAVDYRGRMMIDSLSAQFVARVLAPYTQLDDIDTVDFLYPSKEVADEMGIEQFDVLEDSRTFFYDNITDPAAREQFDKVYRYYKSIEGKNFNPDITEKNSTPHHTLAGIPKDANNLPYFRVDGTPSTGFVTFSTGGIHGAEYYADRFNHDAQLHENSRLKLAYAQLMSGGDARFIREAESTTVPLGKPDGSIENLEIIYQDVLTTTTTKKNPEWRPTPKVAKPELFREVTSGNSQGATKLSDKYYYTSMVDCIHEDFTSYYPLLLKNMRAFYNPDLGEDRYSKIFDDKEHYGRLRKDPQTTDEQRELYNVLRNGAKLLLNAASGAGDAYHKTNIRISNTIVKMRIIGQLFLWRIGQAQTLASDTATIASTNTDGIYSAHLDWETNNRVLEKQVESIHVEIEPEELTLISKDSNNRVEFFPADDVQRKDPASRVIASAGGSLACHAGPNPSKRLQSSAMTQYLLVEYFKHLSLGHTPAGCDGPLTMADPIDESLLRSIIDRAHATVDTADLLTLYQTIIASSPGAMNYLYAANYQEQEVTDKDGNTTVRSVPADDSDSLTHRNPRTISKHNRMFIVDPVALDSYGLKPIVLAQAKAPKISASSQKSRERNNKKLRARNLHADRILTASGVDVDGITDRDTILGRYSGLDPATPVILHNHSLRHPPQDAPLTPEQLLSVIDTDAYLDMAIAKYDSDWRNHY